MTAATDLDLIFGGLKRAWLSVRGKDRVLFLHRLLTQDIKGLNETQARPAFLLDRQGKIRATALVHARPEELLLELSAQEAAPARTLLEKYLISEDVTFEGQPPHPPKGGWPQKGLKVPGLQEHEEASPELERITRGIPAVARELTEEVIPNELGEPWLTRFVSFTKGCYIGQEIVARIHHRAHPPRLLTRFCSFGTGAPNLPCPILDGDKPVGLLTSWRHTSETGGIGLGFLKYGHTPQALRAGSLTLRPEPPRGQTL